MTYEVEMATAIRGMVSGSHDAGPVPKSTMWEFDELCLTPIKNLSPAGITAIREQAHASQAGFASQCMVQLPSPAVETAHAKIQSRLRIVGNAQATLDFRA